MCWRAANYQPALAGGAAVVLACRQLPARSWQVVQQLCWCAANYQPALQVVLIPIPNSKTAPEVKAAMLAKVDELAKALIAAGVKVATDTRDNYTPGWKYNHWELKGVPLRLELGGRDMEGEVLVAARRDTGARALLRRPPALNAARSGAGRHPSA